MRPQAKKMRPPGNDRYTGLYHPRQPLRVVATQSLGSGIWGRRLISFHPCMSTARYSLLWSVRGIDADRAAQRKVTYICHGHGTAVWCKPHSVLHLRNNCSPIRRRVTDSLPDTTQPVHAPPRRRQTKDARSLEAHPSCASANLCCAMPSAPSACSSTPARCPLSSSRAISSASSSFRSSA